MKGLLVVLLLVIFSACVLSNELAAVEEDVDKYSLCLMCNGLNYYDCCIMRAAPGTCCPTTTTAATTASS
ncbi:hypothetical protein CHUAL_008299 [Chamberlinius hualienensis]